MAAKILVVDDEPQFERLLLQRFRRKIRSQEYDFSFAENGIHALEILDQRSGEFDIVLSDINMPKMDGLTFLSRLKETRPQIRTVMVSAYGDMSNIRAAMNLGAFDFVTKPINFEDLETTIQKTLEEAGVAKQAALAKELEQMNEKLRELDQMKTHFFTNISHEFRTPLTVISGMADQMKEKPERWFSQGLKMIKRNSINLLDLVNQILDLAKLESGRLELNLVQSDVINYLRYIVESFHSLAENKNIELEFKSAKDQLLMDYDPERLLRVVSNLLSNAVKFTPAGGKVILKADVGKLKPRDLLSPAEASKTGIPNPDAEERLNETAAMEKNAWGDGLLLTVSDTGPGIPEDQLPYIFDRFYQVDGSSTREGEGTGIGLALTRELVHLMEGDISVESTPGKGTVFQIIFPIRQSARYEPRREEADPPLLADHEAYLITGPDDPAVRQGPSGDETERPNLLIVEDNPDIVEYLRSCLESEYELLIARDGQEGIDRAIEEVPDLIVSDVMMPRKNGFELCQALKTDERTSHIPIVLLTARADQESKVEGLTRGADAYLSKPFDKTELSVRLEQLLALRRQLQERYRNFEQASPSEDEAVRQEDSFLKRVREEVEKNLDDENLSISGLARSIGVSRAQLHNKVKALTGRSPSIMVRRIRLYKAKELLRTSDLNISQVAYEVGFRDPSYFSRTFSEEFGVSPKEMRD